MEAENAGCRRSTERSTRHGLRINEIIDNQVSLRVRQVIGHSRPVNASAIQDSHQHDDYYLPDALPH
jgi:hypothetical protein